MPDPGETICGVIRLESLAPPAMGAEELRPVFSARIEDSHETFWLTAIDASFTPTSIDVSRFMAGANGIAALRHPTLVRIVVVDREIDFCVVGYEALPGAEPLADVVDRGEAHAHLPRVALEVARGLAFLHRKGLTHGSLSERSVLLWEDVPLLWQYGLASLCVADVYGPRAAAHGGDAIAPEVAEGDPVAPPSDVYAWGALVARLSVGGGPDMIRRFRTQDVGPAVPPRLVALARRALQPAIKARPADGTKLLQALHEALAPEEGQRPPPWMQARSTDVEGLRRLASSYLDELDRVDAHAPVGIPDGLVATPSGRLKLPDRDSVRIDTRAPTPEPPRAPPAAPPPAPIPPPPESGVDPDDAAFEEFLDDAVLEEVVPRPVREEIVEIDVSPEPEPDPLAEALARSAAEARRLERKQRKKDKAAKAGKAGRRDARAPMGSPHALDHAAYEPALPPPRRGAADPDLPPPRETAPARATKVAAYVPPRLPGPHGPAAGRMALVLATIVTGLTAWGSVSAYLGGASLPGVGARPAAAPEGSPAVPDASAAGDAAAAPEPPPVPTITAPCPDGTARLPSRAGEPLSTVCIDEAERPGFMEVPQVGLSLSQAKAICADAERRLCTRGEWMLACAGTEGREHPYGPELVPGRCRADLRTSEPRYGPSGGRSKCVTPEGVLDLVGNAGEWIAEGTVVGGSVWTPGPSCRTELTPVGRVAPPDAGVRCCVDVPMR